MEIKIRMEERAHNKLGNNMSSPTFEADLFLEEGMPPGKSGRALLESAKVLFNREACVTGEKRVVYACVSDGGPNRQSYLQVWTQGGEEALGFAKMIAIGCLVKAVQMAQPVSLVIAGARPS